jgi:hypothetical protein
MDEVITRIIGIERQCSADVEQAGKECSKRIEAHKSLLEGKKTSQYALITAAENTRLLQSVEDAKRQTEVASAAFRRDSESLFRDPALNEAIKEDIISILFED